MARFPASTSPFVGRTDELAAIGAAFGQGGRAVTLRGPAGIGKTRLAVEHAARSRRSDRELRACFCDLSPARDPAGVVLAAVEALGAPDHAVAGGAEPLEALGRWLSRRGRRLVVLDNCEHVLPIAARLVASWLASAPDLLLLSTSRESLGAAGEQVIDVGGLADEPATRLLLERAAEVGARLSPEGQARDIEAIVAGLAGNPLAIELAAARTEVLPLAEVARRLEQPLVLLRDPQAAPEDRHGSLWSALAASWELLADWERAALAQVSVFEGGIPLCGAEAVLDLPGAAPPGGPSVLDALHSLVRRSLARVTTAEEPGAEPRFALLPSVRRFAGHQLAARGAGPTEERHAGWFLERGAGWLEGTRGPEAGAFRARLRREAANLRAVLERGLGGDSADGVQRAVDALACLHPVLLSHASQREYLALLHRVLRRADELGLAPSEARVGHWTMTAQVARDLGDLVEAQRSTERALQLARDGAFAREEIWALGQLGNLCGLRGDAAGSRRHFEQTRDLARRCGDLRAEALALTALASSVDVRAHGDWAAAAERLGRALELLWRAEDKTLMARTRILQGSYLREDGQPERGAARIEEALAVAGQVGDERGRLRGLQELARTWHVLGRTDDAREAWTEAEQLADSLDARRYRADVRLCAALLDIEEGALEPAWRRLTEADELRGEPGRTHTGPAGAADAVLGALLALRGDSAGADRLGARARQRLEAAEPPYGAFVPLGEAIRAAGEAGRALAEGDLEAADTALDEAAELLSAARPPGLSLVEEGIRAVEALIERTGARRDAWRFARDGSWFQPLGRERIDVTHRPVLARLLAGLVEARRDRPRAGLDMDAMTTLGWPGEHIKPSAARNRVYVAVSTLRKLGLELLGRQDGGYRLDPDVPALAADPSPG